MREPRPHPTDRKITMGTGLDFRSDLGSPEIDNPTKLPEIPHKYPEARPSAAALVNAPGLEAGRDLVAAEYLGKTEDQKRTQFRTWFNQALNPGMIGTNGALDALRWLSMSTPAELGGISNLLHTEQVLCRAMLEIRSLLVIGTKPSEVAEKLANLKENNVSIGINFLPDGNSLDFIFRMVRARGAPVVATAAHAAMEIDGVARSKIDRNKYLPGNRINPKYGSPVSGTTFAAAVSEAKTLFKANVGGGLATQADCDFLMNLGQVMCESFLLPAELGFPDPKYEKSVEDIAVYRKVVQSPSTIPFVAEQIPERVEAMGTSYFNASKDEPLTPTGRGLSSIDAVLDSSSEVDGVELMARNFAAKPLSLQRYYQIGTGYSNGMAEVLAAFAVSPRGALIKVLPEKFPTMFPGKNALEKIEMIEPLFDILFEGCASPGRNTRLDYGGRQGSTILYKQGQHEGVMDRGHIDAFLNSPVISTILNVGDNRENARLRNLIASRHASRMAYVTKTGGGNVGVGLVKMGGTLVGEFAKMATGGK